MEILTSTCNDVSRYHFSCEQEVKSSLHDVWREEKPQFLLQALVYTGYTTIHGQTVCKLKFNQPMFGWLGWWFGIFWVVPESEGLLYRGFSRFQTSGRQATNKWLV